jgi:two-component system, cell cycle sensor histidine kinase and response regulator CckA
MSAPRLLIVDDDCSILSVTAALVGRLLSGVEIDTAESPHAALRNAQTTPYTAVLTDVCMPGQNGYELAAHIQAIQPNTKIVYMSGFDKEYRAEPFAFLRKPFDVDVLVTTLRTALSV